MAIDHTIATEQELRRRVRELEKTLAETENHANRVANQAAINRQSRVDAENGEKIAMTALMAIRGRLEALLKATSVPGLCRYCQQEVRYVLHKNHKRCPYDVDGHRHYESCGMVKREDLVSAGEE